MSWRHNKLCEWCLHKYIHSEWVYLLAWNETVYGRLYSKNKEVKGNIGLQWFRHISELKCIIHALQRVLEKCEKAWVRCSIDSCWNSLCKPNFFLMFISASSRLKNKHGTDIYHCVIKNNRNLPNESGNRSTLTSSLCLFLFFRCVSNSEIRVWRHTGAPHADPEHEEIQTPPLCFQRWENAFVCQT